MGRRQPARLATLGPSGALEGPVVKSSDEWLVLLPDRMPAYISVEQYEANLARLAANRPFSGVPAASRPVPSQATRRSPNAHSLNHTEGHRRQAGDRLATGWRN
jgi:hypothetical protein